MNHTLKQEYRIPCIFKQLKKAFYLKLKKVKKLKNNIYGLFI